MSASQAHSPASAHTPASSPPIRKARPFPLSSTCDDSRTRSLSPHLQMQALFLPFKHLAGTFPFGTFDSLRWRVIKPFNQSHSTFQKFVVRNSLPRPSL